MRTRFSVGTGDVVGKESTLAALEAILELAMRPHSAAPRIRSDKDWTISGPCFDVWSSCAMVRSINAHFPKILQKKCPFSDRSYLEEYMARLGGEIAWSFNNASPEYGDPHYKLLFFGNGTDMPSGQADVLASRHLLRPPGPREVRLDGDKCNGAMVKFTLEHGSYSGRGKATIRELYKAIFDDDPANIGDKDPLTGKPISRPKTGGD